MTPKASDISSSVTKVTLAVFRDIYIYITFHTGSS